MFHSASYLPEGKNTLSLITTGALLKSVHSRQCIKQADSSLLSCHNTLHSSSVYKLTILNPTLCLVHKLTFPSTNTPLPLFRRHTMSYGGVVVLKASSPLSLNAWVTSTLSLSNSYRSRMDRGGQHCSLPCCKTSGTQ